MDSKMELMMLVLCVAPVIVRSITISSNGNSPGTKMLGGMKVNVQQGFVPMIPEAAALADSSKESSNYDESRKITNNSTKLAINERYRRLIPYMTFYYANDLPIPTTERISTVEVEKAQIIEAQELANQRQAKKIIFQQHNIPRYQGNRLTQYNIASANPSKIYYKNGIPFYQIPSESFQPIYSDIPVYDYDDRITQKLTAQPVGFTSTQKPFLNLYNEESPNIRYYLSEREQSPKYKLVPYDQTPPIAVPYAQTPVNVPLERKPIKLTYQQSSQVKIPVKVAYQQTTPVRVPYEQSPIKLSYENTPIKLQYEQKKPQNNVYPSRKPVIMSVLVPKELYVKPRPVRPPFIYDSGNVPVRKQPTIVSESYYEKHRPQTVLSEPVIESGFKPIVNVAAYTTEPSIQTSTLSLSHSTTPQYKPSAVTSVSDKQQNYYHYVVDQPKPEPSKPTPVSSVTLSTLLNSLQMNKSIPKPITTENVSSSIRTLLQVLNTLKTTPSPKVELVPISTPKPFAASKVIANESPIVTHLRPEIIKTGLQEEHLIPVSTPSQHLDDEQSKGGGTSIRYPLPVSSDDEGGTPGRPGVDYPVLSTIPHTAFDCKTQRYKGFFADTETRCQVWHYCDLNGGQASFLCPNGTIFSQAGLTCDWWFNVRCDSTTQLYVLNESLYKFILPQVPKFPEDYSGPLVDKYLTLKFKEMEEEFKKNKNKHVEDNSSEEDESSESSTEAATSDEMDKRQLGELREASVIVESPGYSGKVERLSDD